MNLDITIGTANYIVIRTGNLDKVSAEDVKRTIHNETYDYTVWLVREGKNPSLPQGVDAIPGSIIIKRNKRLLDIGTVVDIINRIALEYIQNMTNIRNVRYTTTGSRSVIYIDIE